MKKIAIAASMGFYIAVASQAGVAAESVKVTGIFSDLYYNKQGGDLLGTEIFIVNAGDAGYAAFFQYWAGGTSPPLSVPVRVVGNEVTFAIPAPSIGQGEYHGRIGPTGFDGVRRHPLANGGQQDEPVNLLRKSSYWQ